MADRKAYREATGQRNPRPKVQHIRGPQQQDRRHTNVDAGPAAGKRRRCGLHPSSAHASVPRPTAEIKQEATSVSSTWYHFRADSDQASVGADNSFVAAQVVCRAGNTILASDQRMTNTAPLSEGSAGAASVMKDEPDFSADVAMNAILAETQETVSAPRLSTDDMQAETQETVSAPRLSIPAAAPAAAAASSADVKPPVVRRAWTSPEAVPKDTPVSVFQPLLQRTTDNLAMMSGLAERLEKDLKRTDLTVAQRAKKEDALHLALETSWAI